MCLLVLTGLIVLGLIVRSGLSVEHPSKFQIVLEDLVSAVAGLLDEWIGPKGRHFLPLIGALGAFILVGNYLGLIPGLMAPTSNINVTLGCAMTIWVYYHYQGIRAQGLGRYIEALLRRRPGAPVLDAAAHVPDRSRSAIRRGCCRCRCGCSATSSAKSWSS